MRLPGASSSLAGSSQFSCWAGLLPWQSSLEVDSKKGIIHDQNVISISVGIIDTNPGKFKEGRFISTKSGIGSSSKLQEVENPNAPNVLTNDPDFFDDYPPKNAGKINLN